jgi:uncharacterized delta-60 repeat protein
VNTSYAGCKIALARYSTDGSLDATFSGDGKHMLRIGMLDTFSHGGLVIQPNGKIVVAGTACGPDQTNCNFAVLRFNANGSLDTTFSGDGKVMIGFGSGRGDYATDLALQGDGKIVVAGSTLDSAETNCYTAVARLTSAGALDTTFSGDGKQTVNFGGTTCFSNNGGVAIDGNGRIVLGGYKATATDRYFTVARLTSAGALDTSFSGTGKKITNVTGDGEVGSVVRVAGTRILLAGRTNFAGTQDFALVRYNDNGTLDTSFSGDGLAFFDFQGDFDVARGMAIDANGKYVLVGQIFKDGQSDFGVMRVLP